MNTETAYGLGMSPSVKGVRTDRIGLPKKKVIIIDGQEYLSRKVIAGIAWANRSDFGVVILAEQEAGLPGSPLPLWVLAADETASMNQFFQQLTQLMTIYRVERGFYNNREWGDEYAYRYSQYCRENHIQCLKVSRSPEFSENDSGFHLATIERSLNRFSGDSIEEMGRILVTPVAQALNVLSQPRNDAIAAINESPYLIALANGLAEIEFHAPPPPGPKREKPRVPNYRRVVNSYRSR